jgi:hypothetical protein
MRKMPRQKNAFVSDGRSSGPALTAKPPRRRAFCRPGDSAIVSARAMIHHNICVKLIENLDIMGSRQDIRADCSGIRFKLFGRHSSAG